MIAARCPLTANLAIGIELRRGLNKTERFEKIPHSRYINFVAAFLAANQGTRAEAVAAWTELKQLDAPTNYAAWIKARAKRTGKRR